MNSDNSQHSADEHVSIDSIGRLYAALDQFMKGCRDIPSPGDLTPQA